MTIEERVAQLEKNVSNLTEQINTLGRLITETKEAQQDILVEIKILKEGSNF